MVLWKPYVTLHACYISAIDRFLWSGSGIWLCLAVKLARVMSTNASTPGLTLAKVPAYSCIGNCRLGCFGICVTGVCLRYHRLLMHSQRPGLDCAELCKHRKEQCLFQRTAALAGLQTFHVDRVKFGNNRWLLTFMSLSVFWERENCFACVWRLLTSTERGYGCVWYASARTGTIRGFFLWQIHAFLEMVRMLLETKITRAFL